MACDCSSRCFLITICIIQLAVTVERHVFDFLGYMWALIIGDLLQLLFVIICLFGVCQYRPKIVAVYLVWCLIWLGWNIFVVCYYSDLGILNKDSLWLSLTTSNRNWWITNGPGCGRNASIHLSVEPNNSAGRSDLSQHVSRSNCFLEYYLVEIIQAGVQCLLALLGFCASCCVVYVFTEEDDSSQPVQGELEYIRMRYRSPARNTFHDHRMYDTLATNVSRGSSNATYLPVSRKDDNKKSNKQHKLNSQSDLLSKQSNANEETPGMTII